jgi:class 3 adenylate cyclase
MEGLPAFVPRYGDDIGGIGVHIGARVSALAGPNDVLVSSTLRDLVIGSGLEFEERGAHELKGVPGEWRRWARQFYSEDALVQVRARPGPSLR